MMTTRREPPHPRVLRLLQKHLGGHYVVIRVNPEVTTPARADASLRGEVEHDIGRAHIFAQQFSVRRLGRLQLQQIRLPKDELRMSDKAL